ncbi:phosphoglycerate mutase [Peribacillus butanolivorans]|uniref:histidine phosphatase family protein n=1 Tax=Peribacillus butanolivorans TaxID=421767 RepID=UPI0006A6F02F|nr:histidine phosphatase family protein [Peribacillus butanolivorans]KON70734.1 phosphoglycerate mutase [Peribacillus butanolivorans]
MQILLIRHGESEDDFLEKDYTGSTDLPLTSKGLIQVKKMSNRVLNEFPPDFIWSSTLKRASKAAEILSNTIGCPVEYLDDLIEKQETESKLEFKVRGEQIFSFIKENSKEFNRIAIISHGGMITKIIESFLQLPTVNNNVWFNSDNTGIHLLEYIRNVQLIRFTNSTSHLN